MVFVPSKWVFPVALPSIVLIGWIDYVTGRDVSMSALYLVPIVAVAWYGARRDAAISAIVAAVLATFADEPWLSQTALIPLVWNSFSSLVIFVAAAGVVGQLRFEREQLSSLTRDLKKGYGREAMLARTDALTALPNLRAFVEAIQRESARAVREGSQLCVLYVDLDDFKSVNDRYGHTTGDTVLQSVATALTSSVRGGDVVARIGGDEFIILLWHATATDAEVVAERIAQRIQEIAAEYPLSHLGASLGVRMFERAPENAEDVVRLADDAMYAEKARRKSLRAEQ